MNDRVHSDFKRVLDSKGHIRVLNDADKITRHLPTIDQLSPAFRDHHWLISSHKSLRDHGLYPIFLPLNVICQWVVSKSGNPWKKMMDLISTFLNHAIYIYYLRFKRYVFIWFYLMPEVRGGLRWWYNIIIIYIYIHLFSD